VDLWQKIDEKKATGTKETGYYYSETFVIKLKSAKPQGRFLQGSIGSFAR